MGGLSGVAALTFDLFGTILDLGGSLTPTIAGFLKAKHAHIPPDRFWISGGRGSASEQYQDNILMMGHSGYLETAGAPLSTPGPETGSRPPRPRFRTSCRPGRTLQPFPDVSRLSSGCGAAMPWVVLSNGEPDYLDHSSGIASTGASTR